MSESDDDCGYCEEIVEIAREYAADLEYELSRIRFDTLRERGDLKRRRSPLAVISDEFE
jgi:hypothetical protein